MKINFKRKSRRIFPPKKLNFRFGRAFLISKAPRKALPHWGESTEQHKKISNPNSIPLFVLFPVKVMAQAPIIMRIVALSINTSKKAGEIIRNVMSSKQLNIIEKV